MLGYSKTKIALSQIKQLSQNYTLKMLGYYNPTLGQIVDKPKRWVKNVIKKCNLMAGLVHI